MLLKSRRLMLKDQTINLVSEIVSIITQSIFVSIVKIDKAYVLYVALWADS